MLLSELAKAAREGFFGEYVKAVVDIENEIMAIGGEFHADAQAVLLQQGSLRENLWSVNLYPSKSGEERIVFSSMINVRPSEGNRSRDVEDAAVREKIQNVVEKLVIQ